jgi:hypothetical protein
MMFDVIKQQAPRLEEAIALVLNNEALLLAKHLEFQETVIQIKAQLAELKAMLELLPDAVRAQIGFKRPEA